MALKSGRVGVRADQVDPYGRITGGGGGSDLEPRVEELENKVDDLENKVSDLHKATLTFTVSNTARYVKNFNPNSNYFIFATGVNCAAVIGTNASGIPATPTFFHQGSANIYPSSDLGGTTLKFASGQYTATYTIVGDVDSLEVV